MKKLFTIILILFLAGCASTAVPNYIQDKHPYVRTFYVGFEKVYAATIQSLKDNGWTIKKESDPALFERERAYDDGNRQTLIFTKVRDASFLVGATDVRVNAYLREMTGNETEVEIRYLKVTPAMVKNFYGYRNDQVVNRIFEHIDATLNVSATE